MTYAIICDARKGHNLGIDILALVDRAKSRRYWWTSDNPHIMINYRSKRAAQFACKRLRRNNARIVDYSFAVKCVAAQNKNISEYEDYIDDYDQSWDAHK